MSTTPQMSQLGQQQGQQFPSTSPYQQYQQQPFGQQQGYGQQQPFGQQQPMGMGGSLEQLQQLGQQQPFQHLLQQLGGQQAHTPGQPLVLPSAVERAALVSGIATKFWDVVTPLPGQPSILYLFIDNTWRSLVNPNQVTHDEVQQAFAYGQQVIGVYDANSNAVQAVIVNK